LEISSGIGYIKKDWPEIFKNQLLTIGLPTKEDQKRAEKTASGD